MRVAPDTATAMEALREAVDEALERALQPESAWPETIHRAVRYSLFPAPAFTRPSRGLRTWGPRPGNWSSPKRIFWKFPYAHDGIAVIVHWRNPLENLSLEQVRQIFQGKITDWGEVGLSRHPIHLITREEGSGTRNAFEELVMGKDSEITLAALVQDSNGSVREIVANDPHALGYLSMGLVETRVKAVAVDGVLPTRQNVKDRAYKLVRRFLLVARDLKPGPCQDFVNLNTALVWCCAHM